MNQEDHSQIGNDKEMLAFQASHKVNHMAIVVTWFNVLDATLTAAS